MGYQNNMVVGWFGILFGGTRNMWCLAWKDYQSAWNIYPFRQSFPLFRIARYSTMGNPNSWIDPIRNKAFIWGVLTAWQPSIFLSHRSCKEKWGPLSFYWLGDRSSQRNTGTLHNNVPPCQRPHPARAENMETDFTWPNNPPGKYMGYSPLTRTAEWSSKYPTVGLSTPCSPTHKAVINQSNVGIVFTSLSLSTSWNINSPNINSYNLLFSTRFYMVSFPLFSPVFKGTPSINHP